MQQTPDINPADMLTSQPARRAESIGSGTTRSGGTVRPAYAERDHPTKTAAPQFIDPWRGC